MGAALDRLNEALREYEIQKLVYAHERLLLEQSRKAREALEALKEQTMRITNRPLLTTADPTIERERKLPPMNRKQRRAAKAQLRRGKGR
jgi:hypothetical protein